MLRTARVPYFVTLCQKTPKPSSMRPSGKDANSQFRRHFGGGTLDTQERGQASQQRRHPQPRPAPGPLKAVFPERGRASSCQVVQSHQGFISFWPRPRPYCLSWPPRPLPSPLLPRENSAAWLRPALLLTLWAHHPALPMPVSAFLASSCSPPPGAGLPGLLHHLFAPTLPHTHQPSLDAFTAEKASGSKPQSCLPEVFHRFLSGLLQATSPREIGATCLFLLCVPSWDQTL